MTMHLSFGPALIRPAGVQDIPALVDFRLAMLTEIAQTLDGQSLDSTPERANLTVLREANESWVHDHLGRDLVAWLAEIDGRPVGSAALMWFAHPPSLADPGGREAYVLNVYTRPEARRRGLARALMDRLIGEARSAGVHQDLAPHESAGSAPLRGNGLPERRLSAADARLGRSRLTSSLTAV